MFYHVGRLWLNFVVMALLLKKLHSSSPYTPELSESMYPINSLNNAGALHPFGGQLPSARVHHSVSASSNYIIVFGGYSTDGSLLGDTNLFYIASQQWSGPVVKKQCCNARGEDIESIGTDAGSGIDTNNGIDNVLDLIPELKMGFEGDAPLPRAEHGVCTMQELMYLFGGVTELYSYTNDFYAFNPQDATWTLLETANGRSFPPRRAGHAMVCDEPNAALYIFGGRTTFRGHPNVGLNDVWRYNSREKTWEMLAGGARSSTSSSTSGRGVSEAATVPPLRQHAAMEMLNGNLYIFGGIDPANGLVYNDVWTFHVATRTWEVLYQPTANDRPETSSTGFAQNPDYEFAPPPLYNAHMVPIPESLDPLTGVNTTGPAFGADVDLNRVENKGFLIYGGVGGGGACGNLAQCDATQRVLGQVYRFSLVEQSWTSPRTATGATNDAHSAIQKQPPRGSPVSSTSSAQTAASNGLDSERQAVATTAWQYARLTTSAREVNNGEYGWTDQGKLMKAFALEGVVFVPSRNLLYEFGGMATKQTSVTAHEELTTHAQDTSIASVIPTEGSTSTGGSSDTDRDDSTTTTSEGKYTISSRPIVLDAASGNIQQNLWDRHTGEQLRERVDLPTNGIWNYTNGFSDRFTYNNTANTVDFLRAFRTYTVSPQDIVLIQEDVFAGS